MTTEKSMEDRGGRAPSRNKRKFLVEIKRAGLLIRLVRKLISVATVMVSMVPCMQP